MCGQDSSLPRNKGLLDLSVLTVDLGLGLLPGTYWGRSLSQRGILAPWPIHSDQGNTFSMHPTHLTEEYEPETFSFNIPVQNSMIPVIISSRSVVPIRFYVGV